MKTHDEFEFFKRTPAKNTSITRHGRRGRDKWSLIFVSIQHIHFYSGRQIIINS